MTQAQYKCYEKQSDSLINIAFNYFINRDNIQRKAIVLYYKGTLCNEKHNVKEALSYYLKALNEIEKTKNYQLAHLINSSIGLIYAYRNLDNYAMKYFKEAYHYAMLSKNPNYIAYSYIYMARIHTATKQNQEAIECYNHAIAIGRKNNLIIPLSGALNEIRHLFINIGDGKKALRYAQEAAKIEKMDQNILGIGDTYRYLHQYDSAYYYLNQALLSTNIYTAYSACKSLYYISKEQQDYKKAMEYNEILWSYQDSINNIEHSKTLIEMQKKYDQQKIINEKHLLKIEKDKTIRNSLIILSILLCIIIVTIYCYQYKVSQQRKELLKKEDKIRLYTIRLHDNENTINRNQRRIGELSAQMEENKEVQEQWKEQKEMLQEIQQQNETLKQENLKLQENINYYNQSLNENMKELDMLKQLSEENQYLHKREAFLCNQLMKRIELFNKLKATKYIDNILWEKIKEEIDKLFDNYTIRLCNQIPSLTESDIQICCLIKLRFNNSDIANLLAISPTSVSKRKLRLKDRIIQETGGLGKGQTLDIWLMEY